MSAETAPTAESPTAADRQARAARTALWCGGLVMFMGALAFASVPLYDLFCRVTGFGGTPMVRSEAASRMGERTLQVRFDANVAPGLGWRFDAETNVVNARIGETMTVFYRVTNTSDRPTTASPPSTCSPPMSGRSS